MGMNPLETAFRRNKGRDCTEHMGLETESGVCDGWSLYLMARVVAGPKKGDRAGVVVEASWHVHVGMRGTSGSGRPLRMARKRT